ncbi:hypothetical protein V6N13_006046 [Hibiscus sabdariffa]
MAGLVSSDTSACGGVLIANGGVFRALFAGPVAHSSLAMATLRAVLVALSIFLEARLAENFGLEVEIGSVQLEVEENVEVCPKSEEKLRQIEEHEHDITEVEPLAGIPASDNVHSQLHDPLLVPSYVDGKIFDLPKGWIVERRPRTSLKYFGKLEKVVSLPFDLFIRFNLMLIYCSIIYVMN